MTENETVEIPLEESVEVPQAPQPARRATHPRRRRRILLAGVAGLGLVYWVGWQSPATHVEHVVVDSPRGLSAQEIRLASGI